MTAQICRNDTKLTQNQFCQCMCENIQLQKGECLDFKNFYSKKDYPGGKASAPIFSNILIKMTNYMPIYSFVHIWTPKIPYWLKIASVATIVGATSLLRLLIEHGY